MNGICGFRWAASEFSFWPSCPLLIETDGLRRLVAQWYVARSMTTKLEEEGSYEYASDHHEPNEGHEEAHIEPAVLYQALGEAASDDDSFGEEWRRIFIEYGSRCEQYGGHWKGHRCVGVRHSGGGSDGCEFVAGSLGGLVGGAIGTFVGPAGTLLGGTVGSYAGTKVCG
jgi:hypothetical protein